MKPLDQQIDFRVLQALSQLGTPVVVTALRLPETIGEIEQTLRILWVRGLVDRDKRTESTLWSLTEKGSEWICAAKNASPVQATVCHRPEPTVPATALLCVTEDELDDWWDTLDVEQKADAFAGFALTMYDPEHSHTYIESPNLSIPLVGDVGETPERWAAIAEKYSPANPAHNEAAQG